MAFLQTLKTEIVTNPVGLSYGSWATLADDTRIQAVLTDRTLRPITLTEILVPAYQVFDRFDETEFGALVQLTLTKLMVILSGGTVDLAAASVRNMLAAMFPAGGPTRTALIALYNAQPKTTPRSRLEELGLTATIEDVTAARLLP